MKTKTKLALCFFFFLFLALTGCGGSKDPDPTPGPDRDIILAEGTSGNPIITSIFTADPSAHVWPSDPTRLFLYPSQDVFPAVGCDRMDRYHVFSTINMVEWVNHGEILRRADLDTNIWGTMYPGSYFMWAPDAAYSTTHPEGKGPYFFFFPVSVGQAGSGGENNWNNNWKIGVAYSDRPDGGFSSPVILTYPDGRPIHGSGQYIDPSIFYCEDTKAHYLVVGGSGVMRVARLNPDMVSLAEEFTVFNNLPHFHEGPWMFSRVNDSGTKLYYLMYAASIRPGGGSLAYATSTEGPYGPWEYGGEILGAVTSDTNHGSIVEFLGEWYLFFHTDVLSMGQNNLRSSSVERLYFNPDGSIVPVEATDIGVPAVGPVEDFSYLNERFGAGNWTMEIPYRDYAAGLELNVSATTQRRVYDVMSDNVSVHLAEIFTHTQAVHNLHIADSYVEFSQVDGGVGGLFLLEVNYGTESGGLAQVTVNGAQYVLRVSATGGWEDFSGAAFVQVNLAPGHHNTIRIGGLAMNVKGIATHVPGEGDAIDAVSRENPADLAMNWLTWERVRGNNTTFGHVISSLNFFPSIADFPDAAVTWTSSNTDIIDLNGRITRPRGEDAAVTVNVTVERGGHQARRTFLLNVPAFDFEPGEIVQAIPTLFPTKDYVVSDFIVTDFGARAERGFDNRAAFQNAINAAHDAGGGVVYIPAGHYEFHSTRSNTVNVRHRTGELASDEERRNFTYEFVLTLPQGVQLRGDWADPTENGVRGTVLEVHVGHDSPNANNEVPTWWNDSQAGYALFSTYTNVSDRFIEMNESTGVTNLSIWYPNQNINNVVPYPWTLFQTRGNSATIENVTLVNAYNGFISAPSELHYVLNSYITALNTAIQVHVCTDIGRIENVKISPSIWANSGLPGAPSFNAVRARTRAHGTGFKMHRSDWEYVAHLHVEGYNVGMWVGREPGFVHSPNAQFFDIHLTDNVTGLYVQDVNPYGLLISNSVIGGDTAVYFYEYFQTSTQFNGVVFEGPVVSDGRAGVVSFESCTFSGTNDYALQINSGNVIITQSGFENTQRHIRLGENVNTVTALNSGYGETAFLRELAVTGSGQNVDIVHNEAFMIQEIPQDIRTDIDIHPRPPMDWVLRADLPRATEFEDIRPTVDVSAELQASLDAVAAKGGGTVFLPAGRYLVNNPIVVPSNVELRGSWDVQHHTQGGGTAIFTEYTGGGLGEDGAPLIQLQANAGIRGFNIAQLNLTEGEDYSAINPRKTPFLIQGQGHHVYAVNITIALGDKGIDLYTHDTSGHYVDYFAGAVTRAGIWVGGGSDGGFIRNMQFNPHYATRFPRGRQGYPYPRSEGRGFYLFIQGNCSALRFGDVTNQTIFNNFVFGSVYGIHFVRDEITGRYPGEIIVVGHGSDGCTFALNVESAGPESRIIAINSQLVNTYIEDQPVRAYVLMGDRNEPNHPRVNPNTELILYNTSFWGTPTVGAIISNGIARFQQANFSQVGTPGIDVLGGIAYVTSSFFANPRSGLSTDAHVRLHETGNHIHFSNNFYAGGLGLNTERPMHSFGSDIARYFDPSVITLAGMGSARFNPIMEGEMTGDLQGWPRSPAWLRFNNQNLANGIESFIFHYANGAEEIPLMAEVRVAPAGTEIAGAEVFEKAALVGRIDTIAANTGSWVAPGIEITVQDIENAGSGMMDVYVLFMPGGASFIELKINIKLD